MIEPIRYFRYETRARAPEAPTFLKHETLRPTPTNCKNLKIKNNLLDDDDEV